MSGQSIANLGKAQGPKDAVRRKYVNERFFKKGDPIDMNQKTLKNVLSPIEKGNAATKGYVDSKSAGGNDLDMRGHLVKNVRWSEEDHDLVNRAYPHNEVEVGPKQCIEENFLNRYSPALTMARDFNMDGHFVSYLREPEQNHHAATKGYADTKLSLLGGNMQGGLGWLETGFHIWASLFRAMTQSN